MALATSKISVAEDHHYIQGRAWTMIGPPVTLALEHFVGIGSPLEYWSYLLPGSIGVGTLGEPWVW